MTGVILAGGRGKRLGILSRYRPKSMLLIKGNPFLEYILAWLNRYGFRDILICTGYLSEQIERYFERGEKFGLNINYSVEKKTLGTGGALRNARNYIDGDFILLNGDTFIDIDLRDMVKYHYRKKNKVTMAVTKVNSQLRYGKVEIDNNGRVINFNEKFGHANFINAGVYVCDISLLKKLPAKIPSSLERDVFPYLGKRWIGAYIKEAFFIDIGTVKDYARLKLKGLRL